jgi:hypothetical protein
MRARLAGGLAVLILIIIGSSGCGPSRGKQTSVGLAHDLVVDNYDPHYDVTINVDGSTIGAVAADGRGYFWVVPGVRTVELVSDEKLDDGSFRTQSLGPIDFRIETETHISYVP